MEGVIPIVVTAVLASAAFTAGVPYLIKPFTGWPIFGQNGNGKKKALIWGAGTMGKQVMIHLLTGNMQNGNRIIIGFLDDDLIKVGKKIKLEFPFATGSFKGYIPVIATTDSLEEIKKDINFNEIILAITEPDPTKLDKVQSFCSKYRVKFNDVREKMQM